jgi:hypothetical protein
MSEQKSILDTWRQPGTFHYVLFCVGGMAAVLLVMLSYHFRGWAVLPIAVGLLGALTRLGPILFAVAVALALNFPPHQPFGQRALLRIPELIAAGGVLAYVIGHYRLQAIHLHAFAEGRKEPGSDEPPRRRHPRWVSSAELGQALIAVPTVAILAQITWHQLMGMPVQFRWGIIWPFIVTVWVLGAVMAVVGGAFAWRRRQQMTVEEATIFLQDQLWQDTRRDQRRVARWLAWAAARRKPENQA